MMPLLAKKERHRSWEAEGRSPGIRCTPARWNSALWTSHHLGFHSLGLLWSFPHWADALHGGGCEHRALPRHSHTCPPLASSPFAYSKATLKAWIAHTV